MHPCPGRGAGGRLERSGGRRADSGLLRGLGGRAESRGEAAGDGRGRGGVLGRATNLLKVLTITGQAAVRIFAIHTQFNVYLP